MSKKIFILMLLMVGLLRFLLGKRFSEGQKFSFASLNSKEMYDQIITERDLAIQKAVDAGEYKCCIEPPCTMCYMEANQWNNFKAGTCACDDLIVQGKKPCPQCKRGVCEEGKKGACKTDIK